MESLYLRSEPSTAFGTGTRPVPQPTLGSLVQITQGDPFRTCIADNVTSQEAAYDSLSRHIDRALGRRRSDRSRGQQPAVLCHWHRAAISRAHRSLVPAPARSAIAIAHGTPRGLGSRRLRIRPTAAL